MKNFSFKMITAIILLFVCSIILVNDVPVSGTQQPLSSAMEAVGGKTEEFSVNAWVKLPSAQLSTAELESITQQVMSQLDIESQGYQLTRQQTDKHTTVRAEAVSSTFYALTSAQVINNGSSPLGAEAYLVINIEAKTEANLSMGQMQEKIAGIIKKFGTSPQISTCLIGWLDGKLMDGEEHKLLEKAFMVINARIIDRTKAEQFVSYTGFTSEIANWLQVADKKINLNMAMRYSPYDNRTYITIGSPIITREY